MPVFPAVLGGVITGIHLSERPEQQREAHAAQQIIEGMKFNPNQFLHGSPAVKLIQEYELNGL